MKRHPPVSLQYAISELAREVSGIVEAESDPMLRGALAEQQKLLSVANLADAIENNWLECKKFYNSNGSLAPERSTITEDALNRLRESIRRSLAAIKSSYIEQHNPENRIEADSASFSLGYWLTVANKFGPVSDWDYWIGLPHLTPQEACCLLNGLDPKRYEDVERDRDPAATALIEWVGDAVRKAIRDQEAEFLRKDPNADEWEEWAEDKGYHLPNEWRARRDPTRIRRVSDTSTPPSSRAHDDNEDSAPNSPPSATGASAPLRDDANRPQGSLVQVGQTALKRKVVVERLAAEYPNLSSALTTSDSAFRDCRVPPECAPGNKNGYYYLEKVEAVCAARWTPERPVGSAPPPPSRLGKF